MIEFNNVSLSYPTPNKGRRTIFEDVSFQLDRGEMAYLVGKTGSGKSSLLKLLYMDREPDGGFVRVGNYRSDQIKNKEVPYLRRSLGIVFQDFQLLPDRNAFDNVAFALYATGKSGSAVKQRVLQVLARVGLTHRQRAMPHEMSGGEQQRAYTRAEVEALAAASPLDIVAAYDGFTFDPATDATERIHWVLQRPE